MLKSLFENIKTIALVGASPRGPSRASWRVMQFLQLQGYKVYPVNPNASGDTINGEVTYDSLKDVPEKVDLVDIFRRSSKVSTIVDEAIKLKIPYIWMQLDVIDRLAAEKAENAGTIVIMDRCPAIEIPRLISQG
ncbi:MAG: CoA-binding protein [Rhodospirillaceae bacterium]|nr:CoA-binding protein [Rhodospirillaceae bacterium]|tara:strand:- start:597 stop:1001 length:405 start_codon:yes stop_codon:yes gene_type:complete